MQLQGRAIYHVGALYKAFCLGALMAGSDLGFFRIFVSSVICEQCALSVCRKCDPAPAQGQQQQPVSDGDHFAETGKSVVQGHRERLSRPGGVQHCGTVRPIVAEHHVRAGQCRKRRSVIGEHRHDLGFTQTSLLLPAAFLLPGSG